MLGLLSVLKPHYFLPGLHIDFQINISYPKFFKIFPACRLVFSKSYCNQVFPFQKSWMDPHCMHDRIQVLCWLYNTLKCLFCHCSNFCNILVYFTFLYAVLLLALCSLVSKFVCVFFLIFIFLSLSLCRVDLFSTS